LSPPKSRLPSFVTSSACPSMTRGERSSFNRPERQRATRGPAPRRAWCLRQPTPPATASASASNTSRLSSGEQPSSRRESVGDGSGALQGYAARDGRRSSGPSVSCAAPMARRPRLSTARLRVRRRGVRQARDDIDRPTPPGAAAEQGQRQRRTLTLGRPAGGGRG
jgi:hypothetical protein